METQNTTKRFRTSNVIFGLLIIILAVMIFIFPTTTLTFLIYIVILTILLMGIIRLINALSDEKLSNFKVIIRFLTGIILIGLSLTAMVFTLIDPTYSISILINLFAIALLIMGIGRLFIGLFAKGFDSWFKIALIIIGIATIILSVIIFFIPTAGVYALLVLISIELILNGLGRLFLGIVGPEKKL